MGSLALSVCNGVNLFKAELGYVLSKAYWGKGITSAVRLKAVEEGFSELKLRLMQALVDPRNITSQSVLEKGEDQFQAHLCDHKLMQKCE